MSEDYVVTAGNAKKLMPEVIRFMSLFGERNVRVTIESIDKKKNSLRESLRRCAACGGTSLTPIDPNACPHCGNQMEDADAPTLPSTRP